MSTSVSHPPADAPPPTGRARPRLLIAIVAVSTLVIALAMLAAVRTQGHVSGQEFSASHFQVRDFRFYEIPLLHIQITPIRRSSRTPIAARYLRQQSLITAPNGPPTSWHLVRLSRGLTGPTPGDAQLLVDQLTLQQSGQSYWRRWSRDHPKQAQVLWPLVQRLAPRELYLLIPALLETAQQKQSAAELERALQRQLRREYRELVRDLQAAGRPALAEQLLEEALSEYPDDPGLQRLRRSASD